MVHKLRLVASNELAEHYPTLGEAWVRAAVQWQIVWLYVAAASLEHWLRRD
jgi:hypothetical protein